MPEFFTIPYRGTQADETKPQWQRVKNTLPDFQNVSLLVARNGKQKQFAFRSWGKGLIAEWRSDDEAGKRLAYLSALSNILAPDRIEPIIVDPVYLVLRTELGLYPVGIADAGCFKRAVARILKDRKKQKKETNDDEVTPR